MLGFTFIPPGFALSFFWVSFFSRLIPPLPFTLLLHTPKKSSSSLPALIFFSANFLAYCRWPDLIMSSLEELLHEAGDELSASLWEKLMPVKEWQHNRCWTLEIKCKSFTPTSVVPTFPLNLLVTLSQHISPTISSDRAISKTWE